MVWRTLYNAIAVPLLKLALLLAGFGREKVRRGIRGRLGEGERLRIARSRCRVGAPRVLVHCSSAGELESAIPLIQQLRAHAHPAIVLSYYSPSAVERVSRLRGLSDHIYLPFDSSRRMRRLFDTLAPQLVLIVKHDVWPNLVWEAERRGVPAVLVNAYFRPDSELLRWRILIPFARELYRSLAEIHAVGPADARRFGFITRRRIPVYAAGDSRFDRVIERAHASRADQGTLASLLAGRPVFVAGSSWPADETMLAGAWSDVREAVPGATLLLIPHEPTEEHLAESERVFEPYDVSLLSALNGDAEVVLVDRIGILAGLYGLGSGAYVGGGFGAGVHSVSEPAVFAIPVAFGPNHAMSAEARELLALGGARLIRSADDLSRFIVATLTASDAARVMGGKAGEYVRRRAGAAERMAAHFARSYLRA